MKRTLLVAVMVLGTSVCSQSFGFDLLDRMLGLKGSGCDSTCCDTVVCESPCGTACAEPACGLEAPCGIACGEPACGCEAPCGTACEPACGFESTDCGCHVGKKRHGLLDRLFGGRHCCDSGCDVACGSACEPACGFEVAAPCCTEAPSCCETSCCDTGRKHGGLLKRLFGRLHNHGCDSACDIACDAAPCGCGSAPIAAPATGAPIQEVNPMPPAPTPDHSAFLHNKRRVIQASNFAR